MISFGIGYGQVVDFTNFLKNKYGIEWDQLSDKEKKDYSSEFLKPVLTPKNSDVQAESCTFGKKVEDKTEKKPDIMLFYDTKIKTLFTPQTLKEVSYSQVFITSINKNGWLMEILLKDGVKHDVPFISEENMNKVSAFIWADVYKFAKEQGLI